MVGHWTCISIVIFGIDTAYILVMIQYYSRGPKNYAHARVPLVMKLCALYLINSVPFIYSMCTHVHMLSCTAEAARLLFGFPKQLFDPMACYI